MALIAGLLVLLLVTRVLGEGAARLGQPPTVGELFGGIVLGVLIGLFGDDLPILREVADSESLAGLADAGIFMLVLLAGVEMRPEEISEHSGASLAVAFGGMMVPLAAGVWFALEVLPESELKSVQALFIGVALAITAIPATLKVLADLKILHTRAGETIVAAALFDDVMGLFLLAILTALVERGAVPSVIELLWMVGKIAIFFAVTIGLGAHVYPRLSRRLQVLQIAAVEFSTLMIVALAYGLFADVLGMHWVLGAFVAGLYFEPSRVGQLAYDEMKIVLSGVSSGFLAPLFFASIGLHVDWHAVTGTPGLLAGLIAVAYFGKLIGAGGPAVLSGMSRKEGLIVGAGMGARGELELVVISIAINSGLFHLADGTAVAEHMTSCLILMAVVTTILAPLTLRAVMSYWPGEISRARLP